jgi:DNA invertase Pin-like site-specific DNA recombinase
MGGDSRRRQTTRAAEWCKANNVHLDTELSFNDFGRSGFSGAHFEEGALGVFFDLVKNGTIKSGSLLVIESLDRFSRENPMIAATRLFALVDAGITLITVDDGQEYSAQTLGGRDIGAMISLVVKLSQSHLESAKKSDRVGEAWRKKKELARQTGTPLTPRCPEWLKVVDGKFVPIEERVTIVRRIFRETIEGRGRRDIARRLNEERKYPFRSPDGSKGWQTSSIAKIVQGRMVLGEYVPHKGTHKLGNRQPDGAPIPNFYPAIIDEATFWLAQGALAERRGQSAGRRGVTGAHILQGLAKCSMCGSAMHILNKGKPPKGGVYLACSSNLGKFRCDNATRWRVDTLEESLLLCLTSFKTKSFQSIQDDTVDQGQTIIALKSHVADLDARSEVLMRLAETGNERAEARFVDIAQELKAKRKELEAAEFEFKTRGSDPGDSARIEEILRLSSELATLDGKARIDKRIRLSAIVKRLVSRIDCDPVRGAFLILRMDTKHFKTVPPSEGSFAWRFDMSSNGKEFPLVFLLIKDPTPSQVDAFFQGKGGGLTGPTGNYSIAGDRYAQPQPVRIG